MNYHITIKGIAVKAFDFYCFCLPHDQLHKSITSVRLAQVQLSRRYMHRASLQIFLKTRVGAI